MKEKESISSSHNFIFWFHLLITALAFVGPFLFSWQLIVPVYFLVVLQFVVFKRCLLNAKHSLSDEEDVTFYSYLFEKAGIPHNRAKLKFFVRNMLYLLLAALALVWQVALGIKPVLF